MAYADDLGYAEARVGERFTTQSWWPIGRQGWITWREVGSLPVQALVASPRIPIRSRWVGNPASSGT